MARLPQPGGDQGTWGTVLNDFLAASHKTDGTLKSNVVDASALAPGAVEASAVQDGTITEAKLSTALQTKVNQGASVADGSVTPVKLNADTAVNGEVLSYNNGSFEWVTPAAGSGSGESNTTSNVGTGGVGVYKQKTGVDFELKKIRAASTKVSVTDNVGNSTIDLDVVAANLGLVKADVGLGNVDNTSDANKPVSAATQTALNLKASTTHAHAAGDITSGTVATARLGSGTASASTYLRGDGTWATPAGGGSNGYTFTFRSISSATATAVNYDCLLVDTSSTGVTVTLPSPVANGLVRVKRLSAAGNGLQVAPPNGAYIDAVGVGTDTLNSQYDSRDYWSDGTNWYR